MSFLHLINEGFNKSISNPTQNPLLNEDIQYNINYYTNKLSLIKEEYENIKESYNSLQNDVEGLAFGNHINHNSLLESFKQTLIKLKEEYNQTKFLLDRFNQIALKEDNNQIEFEKEEYDKFDDNISESDLLKNKLQNQASDILNSIEYSVNPFKTAFELLVPESGPAESVAGELIRAIMNLLYYDKKNQEVFYKGPGAINCGSSAAFLMENGYWNDFESIIEAQLTDDDYTIELNSIKDKIVIQICDLELLSTVNTIDCTQFDNNQFTNNTQNEDLKIIPDNILNEDLLTAFLRYYDDSSNFKSNPTGFSRMYKILDKYITDSDEKIDDIFKKASEDDQIRMIELIHPRNAY